MNDDNDDKNAETSRAPAVARRQDLPPRRGSMIYCTVQNITSSGACLKLANTYGVPETFELTFEQGRTRRACRVVWRTADELGVAFEDAGRRGLKTPSLPRSCARCPRAATGGDRRP